MRKDRTILQMIVPFIILFSLVSFCMIKNCSGQLQYDKKLHLYAGATIGAWGMMTVENANLKPIVGIAYATGAGLFKEILDAGGMGTPELKDLGATVLGGCISVGIITAISGIVKHKQNKTIRYGLVTTGNSDYIHDLSLQSIDKHRRYN